MYGIGIAVSRHALTIFSDVDRDGDLDLYVANDTQPNRLYLNHPTTDELGFRLEEDGAAAGVDDDNAGMGIASGDYDGNGQPDLAVTNMAGQGHAVFRRMESQGSPAYRDAVEEEASEARANRG